MPQARVCELWKAGHQHRGPRLDSDEVGPSAAAPLQDLRRHGQPEYGHPYRGLRCGRREFDQVASLRVEGVSISATARVTGRSRNTIARWLDRASSAAARFNRHILRDFEVRELQADELYTFIGSKCRPTWLFATIEVTSRGWASGLVGRRSSRNTTAVLDDVILHGRLVGVPLTATDGFESYGAVIQRLLGPACVYSQVIKTRRNDRVV
jgi:hypothetical protein